MKRLRTKVLIILDIAAVLMLMCFYGPWHGFQDWFVTTALSTSSHRYLANILYSNIMIEEIMNRNQAIVIEDDSDADLVTFDSSEMYAINSEYEAQITEHDENQDFKVFEISGVGYNGWVTVIYDPTRLHLVTSSSSSGAKVSTLANKYNATVAVNGGGYTLSSREKTSTGGLLADGEVVFESWQSESLITMNNEGKLILTYNSVENLADEGETDWAVCFEPFLIVNGQQSTFNGNAGGQQPRTAIGQRPDGIILLLTINGRGADGSLGINFNDMTEIFRRYGCINAANLDGGGSTVLVVNNELINTPVGFNKTGERKVFDALVFY
ncbi:MAG: phosphodiester glycosidase family protein [Erysipelotrichaceae bacterium]|nr:phosphodiester glycosidase family protein [Erysipelotrichaceae bacterium]